MDYITAQFRAALAQAALRPERPFIIYGANDALLSSAQAQESFTAIMTLMEL
jgi:hypothetical protein